MGMPTGGSGWKRTMERARECGQEDKCGGAWGRGLGERQGPGAAWPGEMQILGPRPTRPARGGLASTVGSSLRTRGYAGVM